MLFFTDPDPKCSPCHSQSSISRHVYSTPLFEGVHAMPVGHLLYHTIVTSRLQSLRGINSVTTNLLPSLWISSTISRKEHLRLITHLQQWWNHRCDDNDTNYSPSLPLSKRGCSDCCVGHCTFLATSDVDHRLLGFQSEYYYSCNGTYYLPFRETLNPEDQVADRRVGVEVVYPEIIMKMWRIHDLF